MTKLRAVACARIAAVSTISTMKVERPRARLSEAPTRLNRRSTRPSVASRRRHEGAGLGEHRDQRVLAQEGRLAAHVRAGDQPQRDCPRTGRNRWRRSARRARCSAVLDHRVAPALDLEAGVRRRSAAGTSRPRPRARRARRRRRAGRARRRWRRSARRRASAALGQLLEMRRLGGERVGAGLADPHAPARAGRAR